MTPSPAHSPYPLTTITLTNNGSPPTPFPLRAWSTNDRLPGTLPPDGKPSAVTFALYIHSIRLSLFAGGTVEPANAFYPGGPGLLPAVPSAPPRPPVTLPPGGQPPEAACSPITLEYAEELLLMAKKVKYDNIFLVLIPF